MAARRRRNISEQDSDYDGAWKEVLRQHLREILEKYLPVIAAEIDWRHSPQWSDKELGRILRQRRRRPKSVDMLVKVRLLNGAEQWIFSVGGLREPTAVPRLQADRQAGSRLAG